MWHNMWKIYNITLLQYELKYLSPRKKNFNSIFLQKKSIVYWQELVILTILWQKLLNNMIKK